LKKYRCEIPLDKFVKTTKFVQIKGVSFKEGCVIQVGKEIDETPKFALIIEIVLSGEDVLLGCQKLTNIKFDQFYYAFVIEKEDFFIKSINWKYSHKASYIFLDNCKRNLVKWD